MTGIRDEDDDGWDNDDDAAAANSSNADTSNTDDDDDEDDDENVGWTLDTSDFCESKSCFWVTDNASGCSDTDDFELFVTLSATKTTHYFIPKLSQINSNLLKLK